MVATLVTGGAGFVGRALCAALRARGDDVRVLLGPNAGDAARERLRAIGTVACEGDVTDEASIEASARGVDRAFHLAATRPGSGSLAEHERVNLVGTENALDACRRNGVRRLVFVSDHVVTAGNYHRDYVDESFPQPDTFLDPYARTKALAEDLAIGTSGIGGLECVAVRPGWIWGPDDTVLLPELIRRRRDGTLPVIGGGVRFAATTYVSNLIDALLLAGERPGVGGNAYYVTDDERVAIRAFIGMLLRTVGLGPPRRRVAYSIEYAKAWLKDSRARESGHARSEVVRFGRAAFFNSKRVREQLGYAPTVSLREGEKHLAAWARSVGGADAIVRGEVLEPTEK